jgi:hypothetical protein
VVAAADAVEPGALGGDRVLEQLGGRELLVACEVVVADAGVGGDEPELPRRAPANPRQPRNRAACIG